ncbi:hypothetical protein GCM10027447_12390 [Glycomyces halotolerans]
MTAEQHVWETDDGDLVVVLDLPGGPREYVVADVPASTGRWVNRLTDKGREAKRRLDAGEDPEDVAADLHLSDEAERSLYEELLGSTYDELEADDVPHRKAMLVGQIAYAWVVSGLEGARRVWEAGGTPKPNRQERRAQSRASGSKTKASGASANTTRKAASTKATRTRKPRSAT